MSGPCVALATLLLPLLVSAEGEQPSGETRALGLTMLGAIFLVMGMFYFSHYPDHDIRKSTWATINQTVSIFCAVILFKNVSEMGDLLFTRFYEKTDLETLIFLNRGYTMAWYGVLCWAIFVLCAGLGKGQKHREDIIRFRGPKTAVANDDSVVSYEQTVNRMRCCLFLAHTVGFAGLAGWGMKTNTSWFRDSPWHCAVLIPQAMIWYYIIISVLQYGRGWLARSSWFVEKGREKEAKMDKIMRLAEEMLEDGENDFFGLFMSFLIVTTLRYAIGGVLPNEDGEEGETVFKHSIWQALTMYATSALFFLVSRKILVESSAAEHEEAIDREGKKKAEEERWRENQAKLAEAEAAHRAGLAGVLHAASPGHCTPLTPLTPPKERSFDKNFQRQDSAATEEEEELSASIFFRLLNGVFGPPLATLVDQGYLTEDTRDYLLETYAHKLARLVEMAVNTCSFTFAWCFMYATQWTIAPFFDGEELVLSVVLAILTTLFGCGLVYILDELADSTEQDNMKRRLSRQLRQGLADDSKSGLMCEEEDKVHRRLMESTGILIGFVWEQCFDAALAGVAGSEDVFLKPTLGLLTVLVIMPVWLWYIVPMERNGGYILGFLPNSVHIRLQNIDFDVEPSMRREIRLQVEALLRVVAEKDPELLREAVERADVQRLGIHVDSTASSHGYHPPHAPPPHAARLCEARVEPTAPPVPHLPPSPPPVPQHGHHSF